MVKITNLHEEEKPKQEEVNPVPQEEEEKNVTPEEFREIQRKYSRPLDPFNISKETAKTEKINARITETIGNTLRVYTELNNISISQFLEELINEKFEGKKVNRDYYPIEETLVAIPITLDLIKEYTKNEKNLVVAYSEISKGYPISPFDKQYGLASLKNPPIELTFICGANNYLDQVDLVNHVYYSKEGYNLRSGYDVFRELEEEFTPEDMLKNHLGLIIYPVDHMKEYNSETHEYEEVDPFETPLYLYLLVYQYDNRVSKVQLINKKTAIALALKVENTELLEHINNCTDITEFKKITENYEIIANQREHIQELEEKLKDLEEENIQLRKYTKSFIIKEPVPEETVPPQEEEEETSEVPTEIPKETLEILNKAQKELEEAIKLVNKNSEVITKVMDKNRNVLDRIPKIPK